MAINKKAFREELYLEHLEEAAFLYETRLAWLEDEELGWQDLGDLDQRIEAHLDGLMVGGDLALALCVDAALEADASSLHVIVRVFCRHKLAKHLSNLWKEFDFDDEEKVKAVSDALRWECPKEWHTPLLKVFHGNKTEMFPVLVASVAYSSPESGEQLIGALSYAKEESIPWMLESLSRCQIKVDPRTLSTISHYLTNDSIGIVEHAANLLLMSGQYATLKFCESKIAKLPAMFAIAGSYQESIRLIEYARNGTANPEILIAIGLTGNLEAIPYVLPYLKHPDYADSAAQALHIITGAKLFEDVHVEEQVEEVDLFDHELEAFKKGVLPKNIDGLPFGEEVNKLSSDLTVWSKWISDNKAMFEHGFRYRGGQKFSVSQLFAALLNNQTSRDLRRLAYQELVIRYRLEIRFFEDDLIINQQKQLNDIYYWVQEKQQLFPEGRWIYACKEMV